MALCTACGFVKDRWDFTRSQLAKGATRQRCRECVTSGQWTPDDGPSGDDYSSGDYSGSDASGGSAYASGDSRRSDREGSSSTRTGEPRRKLLLDLENLAFLAHNLQPFSMACATANVEFHTYATSDHPHANRATDVVESFEKEAVDVKMVWDASWYAQLYDIKVLVVTNDLFGRTLASVAPEHVEHATWTSPLPDFYKDCVFFADTLREHGERYDIYETRDERSYAGSVASSRRSGRSSWSRPLTAATSAVSFKLPSKAKAASSSEPTPAKVKARAKVSFVTPPPKPTPEEDDGETWDTESSGRPPTTGDSEIGYMSYYDRGKGFGFIRPLRGGAHVFLHGSCFRGGLAAAAALRRRQMVSFLRRPSRKYPGKFNAAVADLC